MDGIPQSLGRKKRTIQDVSERRCIRAQSLRLFGRSVAGGGCRYRVTEIFRLLGNFWNTVSITAEEQTRTSC